MSGLSPVTSRSSLSLPEVPPSEASPGLQPLSYAPEPPEPKPANLLAESPPCPPLQAPQARQHRKLHLAGPAPSGLLPSRERLAERAASPAPSGLLLARSQVAEQAVDRASIGLLSVRAQLAQRILDARFGEGAIRAAVHDAGGGTHGTPDAPVCQPFARFLQTAQRRAVTAFAGALSEQALRDLVALRTTPVGRLLFEIFPNVERFTRSDDWLVAAAPGAADARTSELAELLQNRLLRPELQMLLEGLLEADAAWNPGNPVVAVRWAQSVQKEVLSLRNTEAPAASVDDLLEFLRSPLGVQYTQAMRAANAPHKGPSFQAELQAQVEALAEGLRPPLPPRAAR